MYLKIKEVYEEDQRNGRKRFIPPDMLKIITNLIKVETSYSIYLYKDISTKPEIKTITSLDFDETELTNGYYMYEIFQKEVTYVRVKKDISRKSSTVLIKRALV
jgi:hypothetical protein